jgi:hypothetical protein
LSAFVCTPVGSIRDNSNVLTASLCARNTVGCGRVLLREE